MINDFKLAEFLYLYAILGFLNFIIELKNYFLARLIVISLGEQKFYKLRYQILFI